MSDDITPEFQAALDDAQPTYGDSTVWGEYLNDGPDVSGFGPTVSGDGGLNELLRFLGQHINAGNAGSSAQESSLPARSFADDAAYRKALMQEFLPGLQQSEGSRSMPSRELPSSESSSNSDWRPSDDALKARNRALLGLDASSSYPNSSWGDVSAKPEKVTPLSELAKVLGITPETARLLGAAVGGLGMYASYQDRKKRNDLMQAAFDQQQKQLAFNKDPLSLGGRHIV